jgi:hypothetical protein
LQLTNKRRRALAKKRKHEVPLTQDMLNELNKPGMGMVPGGGAAAGHAFPGYYGHQNDDFDDDDDWNNERYYAGANAQRYKVRTSPRSF